MAWKANTVVWCVTTAQQELSPLIHGLGCTAITITVSVLAKLHHSHQLYRFCTEQWKGYYLFSFNDTFFRVGHLHKIATAQNMRVKICQVHFYLAQDRLRTEAQIELTQYVFTTQLQTTLVRQDALFTITFQRKMYHTRCVLLSK